MKPLAETYSGRFFRTRHRLAWRAEHMCKVINDVFQPKSLMDVGCAIGDLVKGFVDLGIDAYGIEGSEEVKPHLVCIESKNPQLIKGFNEMRLRILINDLRIPFKLGVMRDLKFDLVTCIEVAEHIEPEYADIFIDNITGLSDKILMSYAGPVQLGHSHVNCQEFEYWEEKFHKKNYLYSPSIVLKVLEGLEPWKHKDGIKALFKHNLVCFERVETKRMEIKTKWNTDDPDPLGDIQGAIEMGL